ADLRGHRDLVQWTLEAREALPAALHRFIQAIVVVAAVEVSVGFDSGAFRAGFRIDRLRQMGGTRLHVGRALQCSLLPLALKLASSTPVLRSGVASPTKSRGFRTRRPQCQTVPYRILRWAFIFTLSMSSAAAWGQSPATLEAIRLHRPDALKLARSELDSCSSSGCPRLAELSLLAGYLFLAEGRASEAVQQLSSVAAPPELKAFHAYYLGEGHFYAHDKLTAAADFARAAELATKPWLQKRARMRQGEALLAAGNPREALILLEPAASEAHSPELYYERGL